MTMQSAVLKRVDLWSLFKIAFALYAAVGLVAGLFYGALIGLVGSMGALWGEDLPGLGALSGAAGIVVVPIVAMAYGVFGSIVVVIGGALYNLAARFVGGLKVTVEVADSTVPPAL